MKEEKFKLDSFIGGFYINPKICDDLILFFKKNKDKHQIGNTYKKDLTNEKIKDSIEIGLHAGEKVLLPYNTELQKCLNKYTKKYPEINGNLAGFSSAIEEYNIQKYKPKKGFYAWHTERINKNTSNRVLVFMTYLNDVKNGGTEFKYQKIKTQAKKGLTLIWPTDFTHTHRGVIANQTKYIITGWFNFI